MCKLIYIFDVIRAMSSVHKFCFFVSNELCKKFFLREKEKGRRAEVRIWKQVGDFKRSHRLMLGNTGEVNLATNRTINEFNITSGLICHSATGRNP